MKLQDIIKDKKVLTLDQIKADAQLVQQIEVRLKALQLLATSDSTWTKETEEALKTFCETVKIATFGPAFAEALIELVALPGSTLLHDEDDNKIDESDYVKAAAKLKCEVAAVKAVAKVEAAGAAFLADGRPKILFEAHIFSRLTKGKYDASHPSISSRKWNRFLYSTPAGEYKRLELAKSLDETAALQSASWHMFQILGLNYKAAGFSTVQDYVKAMQGSEEAGLEAFVNFVISSNLDQYLRAKDFTNFARRYNGPAYAKNKYDQKMLAAYKSFSGK